MAILLTLCLQGTVGMSLSNSPGSQSLVGWCWPFSPLTGKGTSKALALTGTKKRKQRAQNLSFLLFPFFLGKLNRLNAYTISLWWQVRSNSPKCQTAQLSQNQCAGTTKPAETMAMTASLSGEASMGLKRKRGEKHVWFAMNTE